MKTLQSSQLWAIVPAAGVGSRMQADKPKQYLWLDGKTILERTLARLSLVPGLQGIVVALGENDLYWHEQRLPDNIPVFTVEGGAERYHSVYNALLWLDAHVDQKTHVLVHDAARPCVRVQDISRLIAIVTGSAERGGLLAVPVKDTLKRAVEGNSHETVERKNLWHAQTPQCFSLQILKRALQGVIEKKQTVTDEAQAVELLGMSPHLVEGHEDNIKITKPQDLELAALFLKHQSNLERKDIV